MVTICYHLLLLIIAKLKHVVWRKFIGVSFHGLVNSLCLHAIQLRHIAVNDHLLAAKHDKTTLRSLYLLFFRFYINDPDNC